MRQFKLVNELGQEFSLAHNPFLNNPKGLGTQFSTSYGTVQDGFFKSTTRTVNRGAVSGELVFTEDPYSRYRQFVAFCESANELKLGYCPISTWYFAPCYLSKVDKGELEQTSPILICAFELTLLAPWARENPSRQSIAPTTSVLTYPHAYPYSYGTGAAGSVTFSIVGDMEGAYTVECVGPLTTPTITLYDFEDGEWVELGKAELSVSIASTETLRMSVRPDNSYIEKVASDGTVTDLTGSISLLSNAFARPAKGQCKLTLTSDSTISTVATVKIYDYYRSV